MKIILITGDVAALAGIIASTMHIIPEVAATAASIAAFLWYGTAFYDRLTRGKKADDDHE